MTVVGPGWISVCRRGLGTAVIAPRPKQPPPVRGAGGVVALGSGPRSPKPEFQPSPVPIEAGDDDCELVAYLHGVAEILCVGPDEPFDTVGNAHEDPERDDLGDRARQLLAQSGHLRCRDEPGAGEDRMSRAVIQRDEDAEPLDRRDRARENRPGTQRLEERPELRKVRPFAQHGRKHLTLASSHASVATNWGVLMSTRGETVSTAHLIGKAIAHQLRLTSI